MTDQPKDSDSISRGFATAEERNAWLDAEAEKRGFKPAPPDHSIYTTDSTTVVLVSPRSKQRKDPKHD